MKNIPLPEVPGWTSSWPARHLDLVHGVGDALQVVVAELGEERHAGAVASDAELSI